MSLKGCSQRISSSRGVGSDKSTTHSTHQYHFSLLIDPISLCFISSSSMVFFPSKLIQINELNFLYFILKSLKYFFLSRLRVCMSLQYLLMSNVWLFYIIFWFWIVLICVVMTYFMTIRCQMNFDYLWWEKEKKK